jgi:anti-sigma B factor antagonist
MTEFRAETELLADETPVVSVAGELDMYTAPAFEEELLKVANSGAGRIVVDLSECEFLDSTALEVLVRVRKRLGEHDDRLLLVASHRNIVKVFEITGLDRAFTIVATRASALNGGVRV